MEQFCDLKGAFLEFKKKSKIDTVLKDYNAHMFRKEEIKAQQQEKQEIIDESMELQKMYIRRKLQRAILQKIQAANIQKQSMAKALTVPISTKQAPRLLQSGEPIFNNYKNRTEIRKN